MAQMTDRANLAGIGRRIAEIRREVGMTQEQLAEKAEISVVHLSNVEQGKKMPGLPVLIRIAEANPNVLQMELDFVEGNARARGLYEKMGFRITGIRPNAIRLRDGTLLNEYSMIREIKKV